MRKYRILIWFMLLFIFSYMINVCDNLSIGNYSNHSLINYITSKSNSNFIYEDISTKRSITKVLSYLSSFNLDSPISIIESNYKDLVSEKVINEVVELINEPLVYIYNTHDYEEYQSNGEPYNIIPTVLTASYMLKDALSKYKIESIVEEASVYENVLINGLSYNDSYKVSRAFLEKVKENNPSIKYFIDIHRDSVGSDYTRLINGDKQYARFLFVVGLENSNYQANKDLMNRINLKLNEMIPNISRGLYEKKGSGVNGIYNQDFSENLFLLEVGGIDNNINEVYNSTEVFAKVFYDIVGDQNEKVN